MREDVGAEHVADTIIRMEVEPKSTCILVVADGLLRQPIVLGSLQLLPQSRDRLVLGLKERAHLLKNRLIGGHKSVEKCLQVESVIGVVPIREISDASAPATTASARQPSARFIIR